MNYTKYISSHDGTQLYTKINTADELFSFGDETINVIIVHGLAEHLDRYDELTDYLVNYDYNVIRYDQRGHGRSEGPRAYYDNKDQIIEDLTAVVDYVKAHFEGKVFLIGHSMGGFAASMFATRFPGRVDGIITSGAVTRDNNQLFEEAYGERKIPADTYFPNDMSDGLCSDPQVVENYQRDDLVLKEVSMGLTYAIIDGVIELKSKPDDFVDDVLIMHGTADGLVNPQDALQFYSEIASKHKSLRLYDGLEHELFNESHYNNVIFEDVASWITEVTARKNQF